jgi:tetratricopeptide (TPR) repeat protein
MSEARGSSDSGASPLRRRARATSTTSTTGGRSNSVEQPDGIDDSFSEERFVALPTGSWESQSLDDSRPSSRTSFRDQRKQFDLTTPTLIDEEDEPYEDQEMVSLEHRLRAHTLDDSALYNFADVSLRRTPGASMYKSSYDETMLSEVASMRRTPGPSSMYMSSGDREKDEASLGFSLTLSTPVAVTEESTSHQPLPPEGKTRIWNSSLPSSGIGAEQRTDDQKGGQRALLAPKIPADQDQSRSIHSAPPGLRSAPAPSDELRGPFSFAPWTRAGGHATEGRFSPNTLRLREDLGNLLQDEDDDYTLEIPGAFRGIEGGAKADYSEDWTGSYVFNDSGRRAKPTVGRNYLANHRKEGKARPRAGTSQGGFAGSGQGGLLSQGQQPQPGHVDNEVFIFGKGRGDDRKSPQLLNFGGAFAPPTNSGTFMRPVASSAIGGSAYESSFAPAGRQESFQTGREAPMGLHGFQAQTFNTYQQGHLQGTATVANVQPSSRFSSSPIHFVAGGHHMMLHQPSEMQATAREFVPMARSSTPQAPPPQWTQAHHYECSVDRSQSWHASNSRYAATYGYAMQAQSFPDARAAMTPSPHLTTWQQHDPNVYNAIHTSHVDSQQNYTAPESNPTPTPSQLSQASTEFSQRDLQQRKRETKRGKRGKKKTPQREKSDHPSGKRTPVKNVSGKGDGMRPGSATQSQDGNADEGAVSTSEDPVDAKRAELVESPATRIAFKDFYRSFRGEERISSHNAEAFARQVIAEGALPETVHWRVYLELADLAKRSNRFTEARLLYQRVCQLQPYAFQGWLEYSKLEEECGHLNRVMNILHAGLEYCEHNETLMTRAVKLQEKMGNPDVARALLARLKHVAIDKVWKTVLEGALVEARAGNVNTARKVLKYLMYHVPWYGPLYLEAYRLERDQRNIVDALHVVERGLHAIPRYGPLWFGAFRICEEMDYANEDFHLPTTMVMIDRAAGSISRELVWKVHLEAAQMYERAALQQGNVEDPLFDSLLAPSRRRLALTVLTCPDNLRWKVWLAAARTELGFGNTDRARALFLRAHRAVPDKGRSATILECARLEEFLGDTVFARAVLCKGRLDYGHDWKVWLESILLEIRDRQYSRAIELCIGALEIHSGTGRLWASLVQLQQFGGGPRAHVLALRRALNAVPKSGEVWCEGGRIHLNPFSPTFSLDRARRHLYFATKFTPQYGDSFVEGIRLEIFDQWLVPIADYIWEETKTFFKPVKGEGNDERLTKYVIDVTLAIAVARTSNEANNGPPDDLSKIVHHHIIATVWQRLKPEMVRASTDLSDLRLACANADPNYGSLWFYCRRGASDPPRRVIEYAAEHVADDVQKYVHTYLAAMIRRRAILSMVDLTRPSTLAGKIETSDLKEIEWEDHIEQKMLLSPTLEEMFNPMDPTTGLVLLDRNANGSLFIAGLSELNKYQPVPEMTLAARKRALFGNDALFP